MTFPFRQVLRLLALKWRSIPADEGELLDPITPSISFITELRRQNDSHSNSARPYQWAGAAAVLRKCMRISTPAARSRSRNPLEADGETRSVVRALKHQKEKRSMDHCWIGRIGQRDQHLHC